MVRLDVLACGAVELWRNGWLWFGLGMDLLADQKSGPMWLSR
jgi:hypothetical protein